jgi:tetratricopeptide (TPR) repeat protein
LACLNKTKIIDRAEKLISKNKIRDAIKEYQKISDSDPSEIRVRLKIAELYYKLNEIQQSVRIFSDISDYYIGQGFFLKAVAVLKQILKIKSGDEEVLNKLASLYQKLGLSAEAVNIYLDLVEIYHNLDKKIEKLNTIRKLLEMDPENIRSRLRLAEEMSKEGMIKEAVEQFKIVCNNLKKLGSIDDYIMVAERLLHHQPDDLAASRELATYFLESNDGFKALKHLEPCFKSAPHDTEILELISRAFELAGQSYKASITWKELARQFDHSGLQDEKIEAYQRVLLLNPDDEEARGILGYKTDAEHVEFEFDDTVEAASVNIEEIPETPEDYDEQEDSDEISVSDPREEEDLLSESQRRITTITDIPLSVRHELQELDFYIKQKLFTEARAKLDEMIKKYPYYGFLNNYFKKIE